MTLQTFLTRTAAAPAEALRRAIAAALSVERPTSPDGFVRFYHRVVSELHPRTSPQHSDAPPSQNDRRAA